MDLSTREASLRRQTRCLGKAFHDVVDIRLRHLLGRSEHQRSNQLGQEAGPKVQGDSAWGETLGEQATVARTERRLSAGVVDLNDSRRALRVAHLGPSLPRLQLFCRVDLAIQGDVSRAA